MKREIPALVVGGALATTTHHPLLPGIERHGIAVVHRIPCSKPKTPPIFPTQRIRVVVICDDWIHVEDRVAALAWAKARKIPVVRALSRYPVPEEALVAAGFPVVHPSKPRPEVTNSEIANPRAR